MKIVFHISKGLLSVFPNNGGLYTVFATKGSAGCIDIGGGILGNKQTDRLKQDIMSAKYNILLEVVK